MPGMLIPFHLPFSINIFYVYYYYNAGWYFGFVRIASPYLMNKNGMGIMMTEMNPSVEFPQPKPSLSYKGAPARGKKAPKRDRRIVAAARAEAEYSVYASTRYTWIVILSCQFLELEPLP